CEGALQSAPRLLPVAAVEPEVPDGGDESELAIDRPGPGEVLEGRAKVVVLAVESLDPGCLLSQLDLRSYPLGEAQAEASVSIPEVIGLAGALEPLERVLADRLKHREAPGLVPDEALLDEGLDRVEA